MTSRNPMKDQVAIVGVGQTQYGRHLNRSPLSLGLEAAKQAITDAGLEKADIDGICGVGPGFAAVGGANMLALQGSLGIPKVSWSINADLGAGVAHAAYAVFSGMCDTALVVQAYIRGVGMSQSAANDPFRLRAAQVAGRGGRGDYAQRWLHSAEPYGAWQRRYLYEYNVPRDAFGLISINNRRNASRNDNAIMRSPITMEDYLNSRMVYEPMCLLDMDVPCDCGDAVVITTAERAKDLKKKPVYVHATTFGQGEVTEFYENGIDLRSVATWIALENLWEKSDLAINDLDLFFPYDGFTMNAITFIEAAGFCKPGESWDYLRQCWDEKEDRLKLNGRTYVSTNGGSLSHGRAGGFNYYTESVVQLRGEADQRQIQEAKTSLVGIGSFFHDPTATVLRAD